MKILLLGAKGNLGTALTNIAKNQDFELIGWDKEDLDVTDFGLLSKKIEELAPEVIINTVAYNNVDGCENDEIAQNIAIKLNVNLVENLGLKALEIGAVLVQYSSDYVFKGDNLSGYEEDSVPNPQSFYAQSKLDGEKELISLSGRGLKWYLIRTARLFGPKGLGETTKSNFFDLVDEKSDTLNSLEIVNDEIGSFTYTLDLAQASLQLINDQAPFGIYHLVNSGEASWYDAAKYFFEKLNKQVILTPVSGKKFSRPAKRPNYSKLINTKRPQLRSWQEALEQYIKDHK